MLFYSDEVLGASDKLHQVDKDILKWCNEIGLNNR